MGYILEELIRRFSEQSGEAAGEHFAPREVLRLMVNLLFALDDEALRQAGAVRTLYEPMGDGSTRQRSVKRFESPVPIAKRWFASARRRRHYGNMHRVKAWPAKAHIRAADADRARVADNLTRHCADGRLTPGELEERLDTVFGARTLGELAAVARDLPAPPPARSPRRSRRPRRLVAAAITILILLSAVAVGSGLLQLAAEEPLGALLALMLLVVCVLLAVVALASLLVTLAPLIALGAGIRWLAHRLAESSSGSASPPWSLRA